MPLHFTGTADEMMVEARRWYNEAHAMEFEPWYTTTLIRELRGRTNELATQVAEIQHALTRLSIPFQEEN